MRKVKKIENTKINENIKQIMLYLIVGSGATIVEWIVFFLLDHYLNIHYMIATSLAFVLSTFANWVLGRLNSGNWYCIFLEFHYKEAVDLQKLNERV